MRALGGLLVLLCLTGAQVGCDPIDPTVREMPITYISETAGIGLPAKAGDMVTIKYRLTLPDGREVLKDDEHRFQLATGSVIAGIDDAVLGMQKRGTRVIDCPPQKHWGRNGHGNGAIPPDTHLIIKIEVLEIE
jgi:FKBP-type peptidyl-prolyl cis-trans isomerase